MEIKPTTIIVFVLSFLALPFIGAAIGWHHGHQVGYSEGVWDGKQQGDTDGLKALSSLIEGGLTIERNNKKSENN